MTEATVVPMLQVVQPTDTYRRPRQWPLIIASTWVAIVVLAAIFADVLPIEDPNVATTHGLKVPPFKLWSEPLGIDAFGRSVLSRVIYGARVSLTAGLVSATVAFVIGMILGVVAGYFLSAVDVVVGISIEAILAFPGLMILITLAATIGPGVSTIVFGLTIFAIPQFTRVARAQTMKLKSAEFVAAARGLGASVPRVLLREVMPNVARSMLAYAGVVVANLILAEAAISFLGMGVQIPTASWGNMIAQGKEDLHTAPYLVLVPAGVLFLTIYALSTVGERVRARLDTSRI